MAIDSAAKRRSAGGLPFPLGPGVTPNSAKDAAWRQQVAWGYGGAAQGAVVETPTEGRGFYFYPPKPAQKPKPRLPAVAGDVVVTLYPTFESGVAIGAAKVRAVGTGLVGRFDWGFPRGGAKAQGADIDLAATFGAGGAHGAAKVRGAIISPQGELIAADEAFLLAS